jgi:predicted phage terminase large subunit-like protein
MNEISQALLDKKIDRNLARQAGAILTDSLFDFAKVVLGYDLIEEDVHYDLCEFMCDRYTDYNEPIKKWKLVLMPRLTFKTTICLESFAIQQIVLNPNIRILIATENFSNSKMYLSKIKKIFESNELLRSLYGDFVAISGWREDYITVSQRTIPQKEPTIMCGGVDKTITGFHYDLILADDLVTPNNIGTIDQINKVINYYKDFNNLLEKINPGKVIVIGTRWNFNDLYQHIIDNEYSNFNIFIRQAHWPDGRLFFPKILPQEELDRLRLSLGNYLYSCNYENNPIDKEHAKFKQEWLKYYPKDRECPNQNELNIYTTIDPAISERKEGDFSGIITVGVDCDNNKYILETKRLKVNPFELINEIFENYIRYKPLIVGIETAVFQKVLKFWLLEEMRKRNIFIPIQELKTDQKSKEYRISGLQPIFEFGSIYLNTNMKELEDELLTFPIMRHDDLIDPLAYQLPLWSPPAKREVKTIKKGTFAYYINLISKENKKKYLIGHDDYKEKVRLNG